MRAATECPALPGDPLIRSPQRPIISSLQIPGQYNAQDYAGVDGPPELKQLFGYISQYRPKHVELPVRRLPPPARAGSRT